MNLANIDIQNPWWTNPQAMDEDLHLKIRQKSHYFEHRDLLDLPLHAGDFHILRGPRQVGKTTLLKEKIFQLLRESVLETNIFYLSCEGLTSHQELSEVLVNWLKEKKKQQIFLFLDEISFVPEWQRTILQCYNTGLLQNACLFVTGSNARDLKESSERFPGRRGKGKNLSLFPLRFKEFSSLHCFNKLSSEEKIKKFLSTGGFPHAIADQVELGAVSDETFDTYRNWIIGDASRYNLSEEFLRQILFRISDTFCTRVTWPKLIENTTIKSHETALEYIEHLQDAFLCVPHYCYDPDKQGPAIQKARKIFFIDPLLIYLGLSWKNNIVNISHWIQKQLEDKSFQGRLLESIFIAEVKRLHARTYFWYSAKQKKEVDLLVERSEQQPLLFDVKLSKQEELNILGQKVQILGPSDLENFETHLA